MSKYIVDIDDFEPMFKVDSIGVFGIGKSVTDNTENHSWSRIKSLVDFEELNSDYINDRFSDLQDDAYNKGYAQCQDDYSDALKHAKDTAYKKGFEDGKAVNDKGCEGCMYNDGTKEHSPCDICCNAYLNRWTAKQADDEIKVGDEVIYNGTTKCIVVRQEDDERYASLIDSDGTLYSADHRECKKTGRHFDIDKILEAMKE